MSKVFISVAGFDNEHWRLSFQQHAPELTVVTERAFPEDPSIKYAVVWKQAKGALSDLPNLKVVFSAGAGVDHIINDETIPDVPIVRMVAPDLTARMSEYIVWQALDHLRQGARYRTQQAQNTWLEDRQQIAASAVNVGIMGIGALGSEAAQKLNMMGFNVHGWSRREKHLDNITTHFGPEGLDAMLSVTDILVCLLPLNANTKNILCASLFNKLPKNGPLGGAVLLNAGRGGLQSEADILAALSDGTLKAASLDVFETEPLPQASPLWQHPNVFITPHAAASSNPSALIPDIIAQIDAFEKGNPLQNCVDLKAGY